MTANLTIPADVWACRQPGVPLVAAIVEGEGGWVHHDGNCPSGGCVYDNVPPAWLVALRDARCGTCEDGFTGPDDDVRRCTRCHDGRLLHDVRVETGVIDNRIGPNFGRSQTRTVRCLIDVAEVRALPTAGVCKIKDDHLDIYGTEPVLYVLGGHDGELTVTHVDALAAACGKPPADWVGRYAVILTEVGE